MESSLFLYGVLVLTIELVTSKTKNSPGFLGCFKDDTGDRALTSGPFDSNDHQSVERCFKHCLEWQGTEYKYAGLEYAFECFCGNNEDYGRHGEKPRECQDRCSGNADQWCGDSNRISIYEISQGVCNNTVDLQHGTYSITNPLGLSYNLENFKFFGTTVHFSCDSGFVLRGSPTIECEKTGNNVTWSDDVPTCEAQTTTSRATTPLPVTTMEMTTTLTSLSVTTMTMTTTSTSNPCVPETTEEATVSDADGPTRRESSSTIGEVTTVKATAIPPPSGTLYAGKIAGIIVAVVLSVTIALFLMVILVWRRKRGNAGKISTTAAMERVESTFTNNTYGYPDDANAKDSPDSQTYSQVVCQKPSTDDVVLYATPERVNRTPDYESVSAYGGIQDDRPTNMTLPSSDGLSDTEWVDNTLYGWK